MLRKSCLYIYVIHVRPYDYVTKVLFVYLRYSCEAL